MECVPRYKAPAPDMAALDRREWATGLAFRSYGLRIGIRVNRPEWLTRLPELLPPGWKPATSPTVDYLYSLCSGGTSRTAAVRRYHWLLAGARPLARSLELEELMALLESELQLLVAAQAPRRVFIHAGVVGWRGRAILVPGRSFSGKTSLVAALVRAGAAYYSDEYAVLDRQGRVHSYSRRLSIREPGRAQPRRCAPEALGGRAGSRPLPVGLVAVAQYQPGARWHPRRLSPGPAALALMANSVSALRQPATVMATIQKVVCQATTLKGVRGEAEDAAAALLAQLAH